MIHFHIDLILQPPMPRSRIYKSVLVRTAWFVVNEDNRVVVYFFDKSDAEGYVNEFPVQLRN